MFLIETRDGSAYSDLDFALVRAAASCGRDVILPAECTRENWRRR
jgi:hypothetical protein